MLRIIEQHRNIGESRFRLYTWRNHLSVVVLFLVALSMTQQSHKSYLCCVEIIGWHMAASPGPVTVITQLYHMHYFRKIVPVDL